MFLFLFYSYVQFGVTEIDTSIRKKMKNVNGHSCDMNVKLP